MDDSIKLATGKQPKGATYSVTLQLFREGLSISEIALRRAMAYSTIEGHFAKLIAEQKLKPSEVMDNERIELINGAIKRVGANSIIDIKSQLNESISFGEIRMVLNAHLAEQGVKFG